MQLIWDNTNHYNNVLILFVIIKLKKHVLHIVYTLLELICYY